MAMVSLIENAKFEQNFKYPYEWSSHKNFFDVFIF